MSISHRSKIARLPLEIREILNRCLENGESSRTIVKWLNSLSAVREILGAQFGGKSITAQNLSEWRQGGYRDWLAQQETIAAVCRLQRDATDVSKVCDDLTDNFALWLTTRYAVAAHRMMEKDGELDWKTLRELCSDLATLRQGDQSKARLQNDARHLSIMQRLSTDKWKKNVLLGLEALATLTLTDPVAKEAFDALSKQLKHPSDNWMTEVPDPLDNKEHIVES